MRGIRNVKWNGKKKKKKKKTPRLPDWVRAYMYVFICHICIQRKMRMRMRMHTAHTNTLTLCVSHTEHVVRWATLSLSLALTHSLTHWIARHNQIKLNEVISDMKQKNVLERESFLFPILLARTEIIGLNQLY